MKEKRWRFCSPEAYRIPRVNSVILDVPFDFQTFHFSTEENNCIQR
jgi:hypothetical protein